MGAWIKNLFFRDEKVRRQLTIILDLPLYRLYLGQGPFQQWSLDILKRDRNKKEIYYILLKKRGNIDKAIISLILFLLGRCPFYFELLGKIGMRWLE